MRGHQLTRGIQPKRSEEAAQERESGVGVRAHAGEAGVHRGREAARHVDLESQWGEEGNYTGEVTAKVGKLVTPKRIDQMSKYIKENRYQFSPCWRTEL